MRSPKNKLGTNLAALRKAASCAPHTLGAGATPSTHEGLDAHRVLNDLSTSWSISTKTAVRSRAAAANTAAGKPALTGRDVTWVSGIPCLL